ncbi:hypothetical protein M1146_07765, partial [Patescibacteria group bacterium]|nr:hypothetical protein [Patescibacteria group bacterium]
KKKEEKFDPTLFLERVRSGRNCSVVWKIVYAWFLLSSLTILLMTKILCTDTVVDWAMVFSQSPQLLLPFNSI